MTTDSGIPWYRAIRLKLVFGALLVEIVILGLLLANSLRLLTGTLEDQTQVRLAALAPLLNASLSGRVFQRDYAEINAILSQLTSSGRTEIRYLVVFDAFGRPLATSGIDDPQRLPPLDSSVAAAMSDQVFDAEVPLAVGEQPVGSVRFGVSLAPVAASRDSVMAQGLLIVGAGVTLSLLLLTAGSYLLLRHVPQLVAVTRRIAQGDYGSRVTVGSGDEIGVLATNFNAMAGTVEERILALQESESRFREIFNAVGEAIIIHDPQSGRVLDVNHRMCEMYGCTREQVLACQDLGALSAGEPPYTADDAIGHIRRTVETGPQTFEWHARTLDGSKFWVEVSLRMARIADDDRLIAVIRDISERKQHQGELEYLAHHDPLTRLPNRLLLADRMAQALARCRRENTLMAVGYLDLDGFKPINEEMGHDVGDHLLVEVAERLKTCVREGDTLSRFGGDEFIIVLTGLKSQLECVATFERLLSVVAQPYVFTERQVNVSASIGVAVFPPDDSDPDTLIRHADLAMYTAKQSGRNRISVFDPERDQVSQALQEARERIARAISRNEFVMHYQPKVDLRDGRVIGVEALIRWQHPERGLLPPAHFLPMIDDTDLAITLGRWVFEAAVAQAESWCRAGLDLTVSINVAARHFQSPEFVDDVRAVLAAHPAVPSGTIELEVLETTALEDMTSVARVIEACHGLGVRFALDDFGTGYASLSYFRSLQVDTLKIDQSFVRDMLDDNEDQAIVEGIIGLTRAFKRNVVAEGVETAAHCVALLNLGCHFGQGFGIARPMPAAELEEWVCRRPSSGSHDPVF